MDAQGRGPEAPGHKAPGREAATQCVCAHTEARSRAWGQLRARNSGEALKTPFSALVTKAEIRHLRPHQQLHQAAPTTILQGGPDYPSGALSDAIPSGATAALLP